MNKESSMGEKKMTDEEIEWLDALAEISGVGFYDANGVWVWVDDEE